MAIEPGTGVSISYAIERTRGTSPAGIGTPVASVESQIGAAGEGVFVRAAGSWITDGFAVDQWVQSLGFADADTNGNWRVKAVTSTDLTVDDPGDDIAAEVAEAGQTVSILLQKLRTTTRAINPDIATLESAEVRDDRQISDVRQGFNRIVGSPGFELSREAFDDILAFALSRAWKAVATTGAPNLGAVNASNRFTRATGSWIDDGYRPGDIVTTASFSNGGNNGTWRVLAVTALNLDVYDPEEAIVDEAEAGGKTLTYPGKRLDIGSVLTTFLVQRAFSTTGKYQVFNGVALNELAMSIQPETVVGGTLNLLGMSAAAMASSSISGVDPRAAAAHSPFDAFTGNVFEGGSIATVVTGLDFTLSNNRALAAVIGSKFSPDVFEGRAVISGTMTAFFEDEVLFNKFIDETESSIWVKLEETVATNFLSIVFPRVKYTGGEIDPPAEGPVPLSMPFQALVKEVSDTGATTLWSSMTIQRSNT